MTSFLSFYAVCVKVDGVVEQGYRIENFSLSRVRRYYETGVKSLLGEALIEYGFPTDAIRRIEEKHDRLISLSVVEAKNYCSRRLNEILLSLDTYERGLFFRAMNSL